MAVDLNDVCRRILSLDRSIRFAGIANRMGKVVAHQFQKGVVPVLTFEELEGSAMKSVLRMKTREDYEEKLGKAIYTFTLYERVKRASIPLQDKEYALLIVSFENDSAHDELIMSKILPLLQKEGLTQKLSP
jgi:hypothetical protein